MVSGKRLVRLVRSVCRDLGFPPITPHGLRQSVATTAEELGVSPESVREAVGWSSQTAVDAHYLTGSVLKNRALKHAKKVADARQFGTRVAEAISSWATKRMTKR